MVPFVLAVALITARGLASKDQRMPRPYELGSAGVIYAGAGLVAEGSQQIGATIAWGYLVALLLVPSSAQLLNQITGGLKSGPGTTTSQQQRATQVNQGGAAQPVQ